MERERERAGERKGNRVREKVVRDVQYVRMPLHME